MARSISDMILFVPDRNDFAGIISLIVSAKKRLNMGRMRLVRPESNFIQKHLSFLKQVIEMRDVDRLGLFYRAKIGD